MTDYIADLLREQEEQEERRGENDWRKAWEETALPVPEPDGAGENGQARGERDGGIEPGVAAGREGGAVQASGRESGTAPEEAAAAGWDSAPRLPEAAGRSALPGAWIDRALRKSLGALAPSRRESRVVTLRKPGEAVRTGDWDAAGLDRLVRRDARRFDGGFQLL